MNGFNFWNDILERIGAVRQPNQNVVISGGCIRDYFLGLEPKDIDVFVNGDVGFRDIPEGFETAFVGDRPEYARNLNGIREVHDYRYQDTAIQIIFIEDHPFDYTDGFDCDITKGYYNRWGLSMSPKMGQDLENKRYTISRMSRNSEERGRRFMNRISQVENGWLLRIEDNDHNRAFQEAQVRERQLWAIPRPLMVGNNPFILEVDNIEL